MIDEEEIPRRPVTRITATRRSPVLDPVGGPPLAVAHLPAQDRTAAFELVHELRCVCGSLERGPYGHSFSVNEHRASWRCLRDVEAETLLWTVRRVERSNPSWRLPGTGDVHERLDAFLR
jgi:hypothetical protein